MKVAVCGCVFMTGTQPDLSPTTFNMPALKGHSTQHILAIQVIFSQNELMVEIYFHGLCL